MVMNEQPDQKYSKSNFLRANFVVANYVVILVLSCG